MILCTVRPASPHTHQSSTAARVTGDSRLEEEVESAEEEEGRLPGGWWHLGEDETAREGGGGDSLASEAATPWQPALRMDKTAVGKPLRHLALNPSARRMLPQLRVGRREPAVVGAGVGGEVVLTCRNSSDRKVYVIGSGRDCGQSSCWEEFQ